MPALHRKLITILSICVIVLFIMPSPQAAKPDYHYQLNQRYPVTLATQPQARAIQVQTFIDEGTPWHLKKGEYLTQLFSRAGLSTNTLYAVLHSGEAAKALNTIKVGDTFWLTIEHGELQQLRYAINSRDTLTVARNAKGHFESRIDTLKTTTRENFVQGKIANGSFLWLSAQNVGMSDKQIMEMALIFGWDIDFALDLRPGDSFKLLYEDVLNEQTGEIIDTGRILMAQFVNQGQTFTAILNSDGNYYSPKGEAMKKAFLRAPLDFRRVSSNFNPRRLHPVTGKVRAHRGTDYVAPVGTPIMAAGNGTVIASSYNKFNGNYVFIRHNATYITKYLHLTKRFVKKGERVKQGQKIGTLGGTGRVTGPHLHYEFLVNGVHKNPRTVKLPDARSLTGEAKRKFLARAKVIEASFAKLNKQAPKQGILVELDWE
ncbi:hypothetical protein VST7929_00481 [Vibrio stylophorae]|uniref:Peptidase M23 n=1 Tax=Vibrio stylophorae TaxID=659351 RepID=A0ABM8ZQR1_9VIBR|nr:peptidoglycan DD-metalloendopeptidase family protein [Vibrio stylophorae]CAH0532641.1 hypothetical protein VST7929_00481 [Vibrio stylophorae]